MMNYYQPTMYPAQSQVRRLKQMRDDITEQLAQLQQVPPVPQIQQTFITPQQHSGTEIPAYWADSYASVTNTPVYGATLFMDKSKSKFYIKDEIGNIKSFEFTEVEELDEKDLKIRELENRLKALEGGAQHDKSVNEPIRGDGEQSSTKAIDGEIAAS